MEHREGNVIINVDRVLSDNDVAMVKMTAKTLSLIVEQNLSDIGVELMFLLNSALYKSIMPSLLFSELSGYTKTIKEFTEFFDKEVERMKKNQGLKDKGDKKDEQ